MKNKNGIILVLCITAIFFVGIAFGATNVTNNYSNMSKTNVTKTNATLANAAATVQPVNTIVKPVDTNIKPVDTTKAPVNSVQTTIKPTIQATKPKPSPGFGIVADLMIFISAIYIIRKIR